MTELSGNSTKMQQVTYLIFGSIFWLVIILTTNIVGLAKLTAHITYKSSFCNKQYKFCLQNYIFEDCTIALSKCIQSREFIQPNATFQLKRKDKIKLLTKEELFYDEIQQNLNIENCEKLRFYAKGPQLLIKLSQVNQVKFFHKDLTKTVRFAKIYVLLPSIQKPNVLSSA